MQVTTPTPISLVELTRRLARAIAAAPDINSVWIAAETSDLRLSGGHCYMELLDKDPVTGSTLAKVRAMIWASSYPRLSAKFAAATGSRLASDMKIMVRVTVNYHSVYGLSLTITDIDPTYTVGDLARRRLQIVNQLKADGTYDLNRSLPWSSVPCRIAVISSRTAAGYGDFIKHLYRNTRHLRFDTVLFEAALQGASTSSSIIAALDRIIPRLDDFDCVVIIRGGGAVSDLASFDDYDLASNVAQFPLPVIVGIGHDRDLTVLDYVANTSVKTPTAAAEELIKRMGDALDRVKLLGDAIQRTATERVAGERQHLAYIRGMLPAAASNVVARHKLLTGPEVERRIADAAAGVLSRQRDRLDAVAELIGDAASNVLRRRRDRLDALAELTDAISPSATLRRGFSITRADGKAVTDSSVIGPGTILTTTVYRGGNITSITTPQENE